MARTLQRGAREKRLALTALTKTYDRIVPYTLRGIKKFADAVENDPELWQEVLDGDFDVTVEKWGYSSGTTWKAVAHVVLCSPCLPLRPRRIWPRIWRCHRAAIAGWRTAETDRSTWSSASKSSASMSIAGIG